MWPNLPPKMKWFDLFVADKNMRLRLRWSTSCGGGAYLMPNLWPHFIVKGTFGLHVSLPASRAFQVLPPLCPKLDYASMLPRHLSWMMHDCLLFCCHSDMTLTRPRVMLRSTGINPPAAYCGKWIRAHIVVAMLSLFTLLCLWPECRDPTNTYNEDLLHPYLTGC